MCDKMIINYEGKKFTFKDIAFISFATALAVAVITLFFQATTSNILLFSCLGASGFILANHRRYKLSTLRTVFESYLLTGLLAVTIEKLGSFLELTFSTQVFFTVFLSSLVLYLRLCVHPPAVASGLAFLIGHNTYLELGMLLVAIFFMLTVLRLVMYLRYEALDIRKFWKEFFENKRVKIRKQKEKKMLKKVI